MKLCTRCKTGYQTTPSNPWCCACRAKQGIKYRRSCVNSGLCIDCGTKSHREGRRTCESCEETRRGKRKATRVVMKARAIEYLGGKCVDCGLIHSRHEVYDFHHKDRLLKETCVGSLLNSTWEHLKCELDKCELICALCHRIRHADMQYERVETDLKPGTKQSPATYAVDRQIW